MSNFTLPRSIKAVLAAGTLLSLGGCMYGGAGYYGDGYVNNQRYECDPYAPFDDYYACDYGYGFANIGYGGGWYDQYYYPGYGVYIFDRGGRRLAMRDKHRRYWARQRATYGGHHAKDRNWNKRRRDHRYGRGDGTRDERRRAYRDNGSARDDRGSRPVTRGGRYRDADQSGRMRPRRDRAGSAERPSRGGAGRPQSRPQPAARPATAATPPRAPAPRLSPRSNRTERRRLPDD